MLSTLHTAARRGLRRSLRLLERPAAADVLLFYIALLHKLLIFNLMLDVRNMATMPDDILVAIGTLAMVTFWTFWLPFRGRMIALAVLNLLLTAVLYADLVYFRYFQDLISIPVLMQAGQVDSLGGSIRTLIAPKDLIYFADWLIVVPAACYVLYSMRRKDELADGRTGPSPLPTLIMRFSLGLLVLAVGTTLVFVPVTIAKKTWATGLFPNAWWNVSLYNVTGLFGFHGYDAYRYVKANVWSGDGKLPENDVRETVRWFADRGRERESLEKDPTFGAYKDKNVILVQAEAFQPFVLGRSIGGREVTPNLNKLMGNSLYYEHFYHQTAAGRTSDADFAAQCSLHPARSGSVFIRFAGHTFDCTPGALKEAGYSAAAFHAYDGGFWNRNTMYEAMNYDTFYSRKSFRMDEPVGWSLGDRSFFRQSTALMGGMKQPFYAFLVTLSSHHPFKLPESVQELDVGEYAGTAFGDYLQAAHYVDTAVGDFVEELKRSGLWSNTVFMLYGDHDNSIHEWAQYESFLGRPLPEMERQLMLRQVPLLVHLPDERWKGIRSEPGGQLDLSPTILHLLGISSAQVYKAGLPLVLEHPLPHRSVVFRSGAYMDGSVYYMPAENGVEADAVCYDLASPDGKHLQPEACRADAAAARRQLAMSDRIVEHDLLGELREGR